MADIDRIEVHIVTGNRSRAGTAEQIYLGIGGDEFELDSLDNDFQRGSDRTYVLGSGANVSNARDNDPRRLELDTIITSPVYLRVGEAPKVKVSEPTQPGSDVLGDAITRGARAAGDAGEAVREGIFGAADTLRNYFGSGDWNLEEATVTVYPEDGSAVVFTALRGEDNMWLGGRGQPKQLELTQAS